MKYDLETGVPRNSDEISWVYNGIDCMVTFEIYEELSRQIAADDPCVAQTYDFSMQKLAPLIEMELRGVRVDPIHTQRIFKALHREYLEISKLWDYFCQQLFSFCINPNSHVKVKWLFYEYLELPPVKKRTANGTYAPTVDREALEQLTVHLQAVPFVNFILRLRDLRKQMSFLQTAPEQDGRWRTSFNPTGTTTGRLASSFNDFGTGTNLQNVDRRLRIPFVADPGYFLFNIDLEQGDSRNLGALLYDRFRTTHGEAFAAAYLNACESGDLHTSVAALVWPELPWTSNPKENRAIAEEIFYHQDSRRQVCKKAGHATNYASLARTLAKKIGLPAFVVQSFQDKYFTSFPIIPQWHAWLESLLASPRDWPTKLTTLYSRRRYFFDRNNSSAKKREMAAYEPQSMTAHQIDAAFHAVWRQFPQAQLLLQVHDSILGQIPEDEVDLIPKICEAMIDAYTITIGENRKFFVPVEAKVGKNWGDYDQDTNPQGLKKL